MHVMDTKTDTKRVRIGGAGVVADYAWLPLRIGHFEAAIAAKNGRFRPAPPHSRGQGLPCVLSWAAVCGRMRRNQSGVSWPTED